MRRTCRLETLARQNTKYVEQKMPLFNSRSDAKFKRSQLRYSWKYGQRVSHSQMVYVCVCVWVFFRFYFPYISITVKPNTFEKRTREMALNLFQRWNFDWDELFPSDLNHTSTHLIDLLLIERELFLVTSRQLWLYHRTIATVFLCSVFTIHHFSSFRFDENKCDFGRSVVGIKCALTGYRIMSLAIIYQPCL